MRMEGASSFMQLHDDRLMVATDLSRLGIVEVRILVAMAMAMARLGYGALLAHGDRERFEVARALARLLASDAGEDPRLKELLRGQPRARQRRVARVVSQRGIAAGEVDEAARAWLGSLEAASIKVALLLTEDVGAMAHILALQVGIQEEDLQKGGALGAVPGLTSVTRYFLSADYETMRSMLSFDAEPGPV